jgi:hypothetical protein
MNHSSIDILFHVNRLCETAMNSLINKAAFLAKKMAFPQSSL